MKNENSRKISSMKLKSYIVLCHEAKELQDVHESTGPSKNEHR